MLIPLCFEDLHPGDSWTSEWREVTADNVADFAELTGDHDPLHTDQMLEVESPFGGPIAHGLLGLSILAGLSSTSPNVATLALIGISNWEFEAPIFFGDSLQVVTRVNETERHGRRAGRVTWLRQLINQNRRVVQQGIFVTLVATKVREKSTATRLNAQSS